MPGMLPGPGHRKKARICRTDAKRTKAAPLAAYVTVRTDYGIFNNDMSEKKTGNSPLYLPDAIKKIRGPLPDPERKKNDIRKPEH